MSNTGSNQVHAIHAILAMTKNGGIGNKGTLPWRVSEELKIFSQKTEGGILIMGRKTFDSLPPTFFKNTESQSAGRIIFCVSNSSPPHENVLTFRSVEEAIQMAQSVAISHAVSSDPSHKRIFLCGGSSIYDYITKDTILHISVMKKDYETDVYLNQKTLHFIRGNFMVVKKEEFEEFTHYTLVYDYNEITDCDNKYLNLLSLVMIDGRDKEGRNGWTRSKFHANVSFDLTKGFPILTTKKVFWPGIVKELLFFIAGETQTKKLEANGVNIWKGNTSREFLDSHGFKNREDGDMGPMYGYQWRNFNGQGFDQLQKCIDYLRKDPDSRRHLLTDFNPLQAEQGVLYPCHSIIIQFYCEDDDGLSMFCFNRSSDLFLGLPFNISSSALFLSIIAKIVGRTPKHLHITLGDYHVYKDHFDAVNQQFKTFKHKPPTLKFLRDINSLADLKDCVSSDFKLVDYMSEPVISAPMIA
jgi:thymidylate synthase